ncbi:MAG TPA: hypothetical protein VFU81_12050, partial [Thermomicrobiales bacterium]|nr:hypothetical protein [Thermomicrobiales bacterium]
MVDPCLTPEERAARVRAQIAQLLAYPKLGPIGLGAIARNLGVEEAELLAEFPHPLAPSPVAAGEGETAAAPATDRMFLTPRPSPLVPRSPLSHREGSGVGGEGVHRIELRAHAGELCVYSGRSLLV